MDPLKSEKTWQSFGSEVDPIYWVDQIIHYDSKTAPWTDRLASSER